MRKGMRVSKYHIAVIDIGKTNKKVLIYDDQLNVVDTAYRTFEEVVDGNVHFEPIEGMKRWFKETLKEFTGHYDIRALSVTTHGATAMAIKKGGSLAVPPVAYTTEAGEGFRKNFYEMFGDPVALQKETATAEIGSLVNVAKKVFFWKTHYPEEFESIQTILNYPQYWGYVFTGKTGAEPTYTGCHTYLYDFTAKKYSSVAQKLGIVDKLPGEIRQSWEVLGTVRPDIANETGLSTKCIVTMGIHDSNSSLLPFLVKGFDNFALNSTGTWCVAMHPAKDVTFETNELGKLVFYNLDTFFNPVKTSIFMGGLEFETYSELLQQINGRSDFPSYDPDLYRSVISRATQFIVPSVVKGTGIFPDAAPRVIDGTEEFGLEEIRNGSRVPVFFKDYERAHAVLAASLAIQTKTALEMVGFQGDGSIFTEGGFRKNDSYNALLSSLFTSGNCYLTRLEEATAFGAALLGKAALDGTTPEESKDLFTIEQIPVGAEKIQGMDIYAEKFMTMV